MNEKFRGVFQYKTGGWVAHIGYKGKRKYLGWFREFEEAKYARIKSEIELFGVTFDRREIELLDDYAMIPLHGRSGVFRGWSIVDIEDLEKVRSIAWTIDPRGYVAGRPAGFSSSITMHRWILFDGKKMPITIDHVDRNRLNNRKSNLRECSQAENARNARLSKNNTSGAKGVSLSFNGTRWRARIWKDRHEIHLGVFDTREEARSAYDKAALKFHGAFASTNANILL